jgi:F0F1-type ATP synthase membrane subunit b/b'
MKSNTKVKMRWGMLTTIAFAGIVYYYLKKNDKSASELLDDSIDSLEDAAQETKEAFKDAKSYAQNKSQDAFKNAKSHAENIQDKIKEGVTSIDKEIHDATDDLKKNIKKSL